MLTDVNTGKPRIFIGVPAFGMVAPEVFEDFTRFAYHLGRRMPEYDFFLGVKTKSEQFRARNAIVEAAYEVGADFILMLDDDMVIDLDATNGPTTRFDFLKTLLGHMEADPKLGLVGGLFYHRGGDCAPVLMAEGADGGAYRYLRDDEILGRLQEVGAQGGGIMLLRTKALDRVKPPFFEPEFTYGTDIQIARKIKAAGYKVASDTSVELGHLKNERKLITSRNRHLEQTESVEQGNRLALEWRFSSMANLYAADIVEYLGVTQAELERLGRSYSQEMQPAFSGYADRDEFYKESGRAFLARQALIYRGTIGNASWLDFLFRSINTQVPGTGLDFACGASVVGFELMQRGHRMHFVDIDGQPTYEFLKWRVKKHGLESMAVFGWPEEGETVDYALALDAFEHFERDDLEEHVAHISRVLKHRGAVFSNFIVLTGEQWALPEHIFKDKPEFMKIMAAHALFPANSACWIKDQGFADTSARRAA